MSERQSFRIDEIAERIAIGPFGSRMKSDTYTETGVPVIRGTNLTGGRSFSGDWVYVSEEDADQLANCNVREGDLVFPHRGAIGEVGIVPGDRERYLLSSSLMMLRSNAGKAYSPYLYYYFKSNIGRHELLKNASQVGTPGIGQPLTSLRSIELHLPPLADQRAIAHILGTFDDKIELNRRMNETLEAMARAIFKSWFVDFDPVRAKASGESPESICHRLGLTPDVLALFPDSFQDSELGKIPSGWKWSTIGDEAEILGGGTPSTKVDEYWNKGTIYWTTPKDLSGNPNRVLTTTERKITQQGLESITSGLLPMGTVLMSSRAPVGYLALTRIPTAINQGFIAMKCERRVSPEYVLQWAHSIMDQIKQRSSGTTFAEISKKSFRPLSILVPPATVLDQYTAIATSIYDKITACIEESGSLTELRVMLLPKLLSGEIEIEGPQNG